MLMKVLSCQGSLVAQGSTADQEGWLWPGVGQVRGFQHPGERHGVPWVAEVLVMGSRRSWSSGLCSFPLVEAGQVLAETYQDLVSPAR
jgi:hypothetical protein